MEWLLVPAVYLGVVTKEQLDEPPGPHYVAPEDAIAFQPNTPGHLLVGAPTGHAKGGLGSKKRGYILERFRFLEGAAGALRSS